MTDQVRKFTTKLYVEIYNALDENWSIVPLVVKMANRDYLPYTICFSNNVQYKQMRKHN